jgi:deoxyadenosine/deoxycytidine kinase
MTVPVLIISGPVGVGKSTVAYEMFSQLTAAAVSHGVEPVKRYGTSGDKSMGCCVLL